MASIDLTRKICNNSKSDIIFSSYNQTFLSIHPHINFEDAE